MTSLTDPLGAQSSPNGPSPKVLVLLAAFNGADWIQEQINSILNQDQIEIHIAVRDDGSTDSTVAIVSRIAETDPRISLTKADVPSGSASQNFFKLIISNEAEGYDYIALSDQDDIWSHDKISHAIAQLQNGAHVGYSSSTTATWPSGATQLLSQNPSITESDYLFEGAGQGCTFVLTQKYYLQARNFLASNGHLLHGIHFHDWVLYALARSWRKNWFFEPASMMLYRQHGSNDTGARISTSGILMRFNRIRTGWYSTQLLRIAALCHVAATDNQVISDWYTILQRDRTWTRRLSVFRFCIQGGRRRMTDRVIVAISGILGWI